MCNKTSNLLIQILVISARFTKKIGLSSIWDMYDMKRYLRRVVKRNDRVFSHTLSIPVDMVRKLELSGSIVELKIKDGSIIIQKLAEP